MSNWRALVDQCLSDGEGWNDRNTRNTRSEEGAFVPNVPFVPLDPVRALRSWQVGLARLDRYAPAPGYTPTRWYTLVEDAHWLAENFAAQAARDGWSTADLFGVLPGRDAWGGIADRLRGSRSLVMTADRACWRRVVDDSAEQFVRGALPGLEPIWRLSH